MQQPLQKLRVLRWTYGQSDGWMQMRECGYSNIDDDMTQLETKKQKRSRREGSDKEDTILRTVTAVRGRGRERQASRRGEWDINYEIGYRSTTGKSARRECRTRKLNSQHITR